MTTFPPPADAPAGWASHLDVHDVRQGARTTTQARHRGALRVLAPLYPEGDAICHHVLVHPPGGLVAGDSIDITLRVDAGAHTLVTTPGATRFYRSEGAMAAQSVRAVLGEGARLEWLPLETIAYAGCIARNHAEFALAPGAEMMGWDLLALGLPAAGRAFDAGRIEQHVEIPGVWLERGELAGDDTALLDAPGGLAGRRALGTLWFAVGEALAPARAEALLDAARDALGAGPAPTHAGATLAHPQVIVVRALDARIEPIQDALRRVWRAWRRLAWALEPCEPRVWRT